MENRKVSVIIPFFNRNDLLKRAVESVKSQTYKNWELILVDDCGTEQIDFPIDGFTFVRNSKNYGPGFSRQAGLSESTGDFVAFLDSDDYYAPEFLAKSVEMHLRYDNKITFTYCWSGIVEEPNETWKRTDEDFSNIFPNLVFGRQWPTAALLWNKNYLKDWNPYYCWEDYDVEFRSSLLQNKIAYVKEKLVFISRDSIDGLSNKQLSLAALVDQLKVLNFIWEKKSDFDQFVDNKWDSKIVWTQLAVKTLTNIKYQKNFNGKIDNVNHLSALKKLAGIDFNVVLKRSLFFLNFPYKIDKLWLKIWIRFYIIRLKKMKNTFTQSSNLNFE